MSAAFGLAQRRPEAGERVRVVVADEAAADGSGRSSAAGSPSSSQPRPRRSSGPPRRAGTAARCRCRSTAAHRPRSSALGREPGEQVDALDLVLEVGGDLGAEPGALVGAAGQQPDRRRRGRSGRPRADRASVELGVRLQHLPALAERSPGGRAGARRATARGRRRRSPRWSARKGSMPPGPSTSSRQRVVGERDRLLRLVRAVTVRVVVVVGEREEQEVVEVVLDELAADAGRVVVAGRRVGPGSACSRPSATSRARRRRARPAPRPRGGTWRRSRPPSSSPSRPTSCRVRPR